MNKLLLFLIFLSGFHHAQTFRVEKLTGSVKIQAGTSENWEELKVNSELREDAVVMTGKNSYVRLTRNGFHFNLKESSALHLSGIKKMSIDDLLLALAMEDMINAPNSNDRNKSENTAVYGSKTGSRRTASEENTSESFGIKRMNGAVQLAENGFKESAVITAKETYRKYPGTKKNAFYRIYFADVLYECGLYSEAFEEFNEIKILPLAEKEKSVVNEKLNLISKKLIN